ncbi:glycosyltransferase family 4 protein [Ochrobactrum sp. GPK 3]
MRIVAIVHFYLPFCRGGAEIMLHEMMRTMVSRGHQVTVIAVDHVAGPTLIDGVRVLYGMGSLQLLKRGDFDVIVSHMKEFKRSFGYAKESGKPLVQIVHNTNGDSRENVAMGSDLTVFNTRWLKKFYKTDGLVVHPPVWADSHKTTPGRCITLVNLIPAKGSDVFYELASRLPMRQFLGVMGGYGRQVIKRLPNVTIIENTTDMKRDVWRKTGILLMPSDYESYGMVGVEAICSGIPVIAHPTPGTKESLGSAGIFIDRDDVEGWEKAIIAVQSDGVNAKKNALKRAAELDTFGELELFAQSVEALCA